MREGNWCTIDGALHYAGCRLTIDATISFYGPEECTAVGCSISLSYDIKPHLDRYVGFPTGLVSVSGYAFAFDSGSAVFSPGSDCWAFARTGSTFGADASCSASTEAFLYLPSESCVKLGVVGDGTAGTTVQDAERTYYHLHIDVCRAGSVLTVKDSDDAAALASFPYTTTGSRQSVTCGEGDATANCPTRVAMSVGGADENCISSGCVLSFAGKIVARRAVVTYGMGAGYVQLYIKSGTAICERSSANTLGEREVACGFNTQKFVAVPSGGCAQVTIGSTSQGNIIQSDFDDQFTLDVCRNLVGTISSLVLSPLPA